MPLLILAILIAVPLVEVGLFIEVGGAIGLWPTLGLAILTAVVGIWLVRLQGFILLMQARQQLGRGEMPTRQIFDGICLALAGVFLLFPGFATDTIGVLLLLPPVRGWLFARSRIRAERMHRARGSQAQPGRSGSGGDSGTIEGEWVEIDHQGHLPEEDREPPQDRRG